MRHTTLPLFMLLISAPAWAAQGNPDAEGCEDVRDVRRLQGCVIESCQHRTMDAARMAVDDPDGRTAHAVLEGEKAVVQYVCEAGRTPVEMMQEVAEALERRRFTLLHAARTVDDLPRLTARKERHWVSISAAEQDAEHTRYAVTSVRVADLTQEMERHADSITTELRRNGRMSLYGIRFERDGSISAESLAVLGNIAQVLKSNPTWRVRVEVHTERLSSRGRARRLSDQRSLEVVRWLVAHGVDRTRLFSQGMGDAQPLVDNQTVEGRLKNRRVELVRF